MSASPSPSPSPSPAVPAPGAVAPAGAVERAEYTVTGAEIAAYRAVVRSASGGDGGAVASPVHPFVVAWNTFDSFVGRVTTPPGAEPVAPSVLHLSQEAHQARPLRPGERVTHELDVLGVRHEPRGVRLSLRSRLLDTGGAPFAELVTGLLALGATAPAAQGAVPPHPSPTTRGWETVLDRTIPLDLPRRYAAASGDANPIHLDPGAARAAGFPGVIAHGMSVVAVVAEAVIDHYGGGDAARARSLGCRFSAPVHPGEPFTIHLRPDEAGTTVAFLCRTERGAALKGGWVTLAPEGAGEGPEESVPEGAEQGARARGAGHAR